ncbi:hypothetical protein [Actinomadura rudentiformis]|uniref:Uncharacterized protein n=1 Tax=Actinomadura rudentiformis TaxID=359158 RepID=A0A6H9YHN2_9ACTN|nr:hypothetical protein [Actinomadura rudentiformis]KAB2337896.1 hypothetical protein F8566_49310 [Actinomadura rudentiformis]
MAGRTLRMTVRVPLNLAGRAPWKMARRALSGTAQRSFADVAWLGLSDGAWPALPAVAVRAPWKMARRALPGVASLALLRRVALRALADVALRGALGVAQRSFADVVRGAAVCREVAAAGCGVGIAAESRNELGSPDESFIRPVSVRPWTFTDKALSCRPR